MARLPETRTSSRRERRIRTSGDIFWATISRYFAEAARRRQSSIFLGDDFSVFRGGCPPSPKFNAPQNQLAYRDANAELGITSRDFRVVTSLARGGLSNFWGAGVAVLDDEELARFPVATEEMHRFLRRVSERIGISGGVEPELVDPRVAGVSPQPPAELSAVTDVLLSAYARNKGRAERNGVAFGRARNAVLTRALNGRAACQLRALCNWGCPDRAIYNASFDLDQLMKAPSFSYRPGTVVESLHRDEAGWSVHGRSLNGDGTVTLTAPRIVLAAGAISSAKLALDALHAYDVDIPLLSTPAFAYAMWVPKLLGRAMPRNDYSLAQLSFMARYPDEEDYAYGNVFTASGMLNSDLINYFPVSRPAAIRLARLLATSLLLSNCFLSSRYSANSMCVVRANDRSQAVVTDGVHKSFLPRVKSIVRQIHRSLPPTDVLIIPNSTVVTEPGEDVHYGGLLPMRRNPGPLETTPEGEVHGLTNVYVADAACFPSLPGKPHTFTMMANADRIGRILARSVGR